MSGIGVVVVAYNSADVIGGCLDACRQFETVVVDNASSDTTLAEVRRRPWVRIIENRQNAGFAAAVNQGVRALKSSFVLLLNPDVRLLGPIDALVNQCEGIAAGQLVDGAGLPQRGFGIRRLPRPSTLCFEVLGWNRLVPCNPVNRRYRYLDLDLSKPAYVEQPAGAFLLFRREVWERLGGWDEAFYPLWFEDVDFCNRAAQAGYSIRYVPEAKAFHEGGNSIRKLGRQRREAYWYASLLRYAFKHFSTGSCRGVSAAVVLGSVLRASIGVMRGQKGGLISTYLAIARSALAGMIRGRMPELIH